MIAESGAREEAAIASVDAAKNFGLAVLAEADPDREGELHEVRGARHGGSGPRAAGQDVAGDGRARRARLAARGAAPFAERGINLHKLESRPRRGKPFEYVMYVDVMAGGGRSRARRRPSTEVEQHTSMLRVLGTYRSAGDPV